MTRSTGEAKLDLSASDIKTGLSVSGRDALAALDQLAKRVERLRSVLLKERSRATELEQRLGATETRTRAKAETGVKKKLERLRSLEEEKRHWNAEREEVLRIVEDLIRKVGDAANKVGELVTVHVIPRPHQNVEKILPVGQAAEPAEA